MTRIDSTELTTSSTVSNELRRVTYHIDIHLVDILNFVLIWRVHIFKH